MIKKTASHWLRFSLVIDADKYLANYKGIAHDNVVRSEDNMKIKFPVDAVRTILIHKGFFGIFENRFDELNKLSEII